MNTQQVGRRAVVALVGAAMAAAGPLARSVLAEASTKDKVLKGCSDGGHSAIDNPDGSYQCNLKDGGEIKCDTKDQCIYVPPRKIAFDKGGLTGVLGMFEVVSTPSTHANPLTTAGTVIAAQDLGITLVVAEPMPARTRQGKRRRR